MDEPDTSVKSEPDDEGDNHLILNEVEKLEDCQGMGTCLFCSGKSKRLCDIEFPSLQGSQGNSCVNHHLWSVFILRNLLQYPQKKVTRLLKQNFGVPVAEWFGLCESCTEIVREAMIVFEKLLKLATQFKNFKKEVKQRIQDSLRGDLDSFEGGISVAVEIREYFKSESSILAPAASVPVASNVLSADVKDENDIPRTMPIGMLPSTLPHAKLQNEDDGDDEYQDEPVPPGNYDDSWDDKTDPLYIPSSGTAKSARKKRPKNGKKSSKNLKLGNQLMNLYGQVKNKPKAFSCKICVRNYATKKSYNLHMKLHRLYKYPCPKCQYPFSSVSRMEGHRNNCAYTGKKLETNSPDNETGSPEDPLKLSSSSENEDDDEDWPIVNEEENYENDETSPPINTAEIKPIGIRKKKMPKVQIKEFHCKLCLTKRLFLNSSSYEKHKRRHRLCKYPCPKCRYPCLTDSALERHLKQKMCSNGTIIYKCEFCEFTSVLSGSAEYLEHRNMHRQEKASKKLESELGVIVTRGNTKDGKITCKICIGNRPFKSVAYYAKHLRHHKLRKYHCPKCKYPCKSEKTLEAHMSRGRCSFKKKKEQKKGRVQFECNLCDFGPVSKAALLRHKSEVHKRVPFTKEQKLLKRIEWRKRRIASIPLLSCHLCPFKTKFRTSMNAHIKRHELFDCDEVNGKLKCKFCGDLFRGQLALKRHVREIHTDKVDLPLYKCSFCGVNLCKKDSLAKHIAEVHTKQCKYYCEICGHGTMSKFTLDRHMQTHDSTKSFICELCAAPFKCSRSIGKHMKNVHCPSKEGVVFSCKYCVGNDQDKIFLNKSLLNRHMIEDHKDLYVHKCDECEKSYLSIASLQLHKKIIHSGDEKAECQFCHVKVFNRVYLYNHYRSCQKKPDDFKYTYPRK